ncbi:hypothetical protein [Apibacter sp. wkB309]|uniref:hypothetical protein n=1 Tax=Apibacter sp. wkB309 TaxID=1679467 RepID=UPI000CFA6169|nr:hypothetical protein [Apibacter sp. wkB309]PQL89610.1 hypothetical protein C4S75_06350 [Apibacter sp. wkB309]
MKLLANIEILRDLLSYDTEEKKFLNLAERCEIHRNIGKITRCQPPSFPLSLQEKLITKLLEIRRTEWKRPTMHWEENHFGQKVKIKIN